MNDFNVTMQTPVVEGNFEDVQAGLQNMMQAYAGLEVTEDSIAERKKDIATLRKMRTAIEDKRKAIKKEYEKPLKAFEAKCKGLTGIIDEQIGRINEGLNEFEAKRIALKREHIKALYAENIGDLADYLPLEAVRAPKWDNKTCGDNEIVSDIQQATLKVRSDLDVIGTACGEYADECRRVYRASGCDLQKAMARANDLRTAKEYAEAQLKREQEQAAQIPAEEPKAPVQPEEAGFKCRFTVYTKEDADSVRAYLNMFGMRYTEG